MIWLKFWNFEYLDFGVVSSSYYIGVSITILCGLLMVSNVRYLSFKELVFVLIEADYKGT